MNDVPHMDSYPGRDPFTTREGELESAHLILQFHRAVDCLDCTRKFNEESIPHGLDHSALVLREDGLQQLPVLLQEFQCLLFVPGRHRSVAHKVGKHDRAEPPPPGCGASRAHHSEVTLNVLGSVLSLGAPEADLAEALLPEPRVY